MFDPNDIKTQLFPQCWPSATTILTMQISGKRISFASYLPLALEPSVQGAAPVSRNCRMCGLPVGPKENIPKCSRELDNLIPRRSVVSLMVASSLSLLSLPVESMDAPVSARKNKNSNEQLPARFNLAVPPRPRNDVMSLREDVNYPAYFQGRWRVWSTLTYVAAPAGYRLFGREGAFEAAQEQLDAPPLTYEARFIRAPGANIIADRAYNISRIAAAAMGPDAVLDCVPGGINQMGLSLRPNGAEGAVFAVVLSILARESKYVEGKYLYVSEMVRQTVRPGGETSLRAHSQVREIETSCLYTLDANYNAISAKQRTVSYLPRSDLRHTDTRGRPVDIRKYDLRYERMQTNF